MKKRGLALCLATDGKRCTITVLEMQCAQLVSTHVKTVFFFDFCGAFKKAILTPSKLEVRLREGSRLLILRIRTGCVPVA